jgi:hypothetical protein
MNFPSLPTRRFRHRPHQTHLRRRQSLRSLPSRFRSTRCRSLMLSRYNFRYRSQIPIRSQNRPMSRRSLNNFR